MILGTGGAAGVSDRAYMTPRGGASNPPGGSGANAANVAYVGTGTWELQIGAGGTAETTFTGSAGCV